MRARLASAVLLVCVATASCGDGSAKQAQKVPAPLPDAGTTAAKTPLTVLAPLAVGVDSPRALNARYASAIAKTYKQAIRAADKADWATAGAECQKVLASQAIPHCSYIAAQAAAVSGDFARVTQSLHKAIATDWLAYGWQILHKPPAVFTDYLKTSDGLAVVELAKRYGAKFRAALVQGAAVVGRRTRMRWPKTLTKRTWASPRGEVFMYDVDSAKYLRLTHTRESVAGFLRSPTGQTLAAITFSHIKPRSPGGGPIFSGVHIVLRDLLHLTPAQSIRIGPRFEQVTLRFEREQPIITLEYEGAQTRYVVVSSDAGRKAELKPIVPTTDKTRDPDTKSDPPSAKTDHVVINLRDVRYMRAQPAQIQFEAGTNSFRIATTGKTVILPESGLLDEQSFVLAPDGDHVLVRASPACPGDGQPSALYLVDAGSGRHTELGRGDSPFHTRWLNNTTFVYEDDRQSIRVFDANDRRERARLENLPHKRAGLSLVGMTRDWRGTCVEADLR